MEMIRWNIDSIFLRKFYNLKNVKFGSYENMINLWIMWKWYKERIWEEYKKMWGLLKKCEDFMKNVKIV